MDHWTIILSMLAGVLILYHYLSSAEKNVFQRHGIPYMEPTSNMLLFWRLFLFRKPLTEYIQKIYRLHPTAKYVGMFDMSNPTIYIRDLELLKSIAIRNFDAFEDHRFFGSGNRDPFFSNNLLALRGDRWRDVRALLSPAFTSNKMKAMFPLISECAVRVSEHLASAPAEPREMKDLLSRYANDVIATCAFGIEVNSIKRPRNDFYTYGKKVSNFGPFAIAKILVSQHAPALANLLNLNFVDRRAARFFVSLLAGTIKTRDERGIVRPDILQLMMDSRGKRGPGRELAVEDMISQALIFFFAGFDSSSSLMSFASYVIACDPDVQDTLREEIDRVLEETSGRATYEKINEMPYLNAVVSETLRMFPAQAMTDRLCVKDFELPPALPGARPYLVKKDAVIYIPLYSLQRDDRYFPEPGTFKPERFLDEGAEDRCNRDAYHPFGLGPRMCIGNRFALLETKILLFHLLARCQLKLCEKTPIPLKFKNGGFTLQPDDLWLKIVPRKDRHPTIASAN